MNLCLFVQVELLGGYRLYLSMPSISSNWSPKYFALFINHQGLFIFRINTRMATWICLWNSVSFVKFIDANFKENQTKTRENFCFDILFNIQIYNIEHRIHKRWQHFRWLFCVIYLDMCDTCVTDMTKGCNDYGHIISEVKH